jgi:Ras-related protein Rab-6A
MQPFVAKKKAVVVGDIAVGKTSLINAVCLHEKAIPSYQSTVSVSKISLQYHADGFDANIEFWDTSGHEKYHSLVPSYLRNADICYLVFALNNPETLESLQQWVQWIKEVVPDAPIILIGNKSDLEQKPPVIPDDRIREEVARLGLEKFQKTSAVDLAGIEEIVRGNIELICRRQSVAMPPGVALGGTSGSTEQQKTCC